jgi:nucleoside triphosphate diphosphatase
MSRDQDPAPVASLVDVMARLRTPEGGCAWDLEQTFATIAPYTIEEAYEVADAIERQDLSGLKEELGDLLFQVVFHARMAEEAGAFTFADVVAAIVTKMIKRHPHVFGDVAARTSEDQTRHWEAQKAEERAAKASDGRASQLDGVATALPALLRAQKIGARAARVGFDWTDATGPKAKLLEELAELDAAQESGDAKAIEEEFGDLLFAATSLSRHLRIDSETALRRATAKFEGRFRALEALADARGIDLAASSADALDTLWNEVKRSAP